jgi:hypothetical protein
VHETIPKRQEHELAMTSPHAAFAYLQHLCDLVDARRPLARPKREWWNLAVPLAACLTFGLQACSGSVDPEPDASAHDGPDMGPSQSEVCDDLLDNDHDGKVDCQDYDCFKACGCALTEACTNGTDDDCDGLTDCDDPACAYDVCCGLDALYAAPGPGPEQCANGVDDDCDGVVDCADGDCTSDPCCAGQSAPESCDNGLDDDCDGRIDCADGDCLASGCECAEPNDCPVPDNVCQTRVCESGQCGTAVYQESVLDDEPGNCRSPYCNNGSVGESANDGDAPLSSPCRYVGCNDGWIGGYSRPAGTPCGVGIVCGGNGVCMGCTNASQCTVATVCQVPICKSGRCDFENLPDGYELNAQDAADCMRFVCMKGNVGAIPNDTERPDDGLECTYDVCTNGIATHPPRPAGTPCSQDGGTSCDGMGQCS